MKIPLSRIFADVLLAFATVAIVLLVRKHASIGDVCPPLFGIPACYFLLVSIALAWLGRLWKPARPLYWLGCGFPWVLALGASVMQLLGIVECPKSSLGIPMCFLSLALFSCLLAAAYVHRRSQMARESN